MNRTSRTFVALVGVLALVSAACGDDTEVTDTAVPTTTVAPTLTFTGSECIYSGPDTFSLGETVRFTWRNESSVEMVVTVLELFDTTFEDLLVRLAAVEVEVVAPTQVWPEQEPEELFHWKKLDPGTDRKAVLVFIRAGDFGMACWPLAANPPVGGELLTPPLRGALFTVEE